MDWNTDISSFENGENVVRGKKLTELAQQMSFTQALYFILTGKKSTKEIAKVFNASDKAAVIASL